MQRSMLIALLILNSCAGHYPAPPPMTRCMNLDGSFYCVDPDGKRLPPVKFADAPRYECFLPQDWESRKNWEAVIRQ